MQLSITWILKELKSYKPLLKTILLVPSEKKTYIKTHIQKLELWLSWTNSCVIQIITSPLFGFWVVQSQLSDFSCSHFLICYKILFTFFWLSIIQILFWNLLRVDCHDFQQNTVNGIFVQLSKKSHHIFAPFR